MKISTFRLKKQYLTIVLFFIVVNCFGQDLTSDFRQNIAAYSPNTAAFLKYSDQPVSKYTGVPSIKIPLYTIQDGTFNLPIDLSYHAGGIKVEEESSWVGLGWSLNCGGQISRIVRGSEDFNGHGFFQTSIPYKDPNACDAQHPSGTVPLIAFNGTTELYLIRDGQSFNINKYNSYANDGSTIDGEPDIFNFQAGGYSGRFIIDRPTNSGETYSIKVLNPESNLKITLMPGNTFSILTPDGVLYEYAVKDLQQNIPGNGPTPYGKKLFDQNIFFSSSLNKIYTTTWYLSKITLPNNRFITFIYTSEDVVSMCRNQTITMQDDLNSSQSTRGYLTQQPPFFVTKSITTQKIISSITFNDLVINFNKTSDRVDIKSNNGIAASRLTGIDVFTTGNRIKGFRFSQDYFSSGTNSADLYAKRLRLNQVAEFDGTNSLPPYKFSYKSTVEGVSVNLPDKDSFNQDYWGYFNGKNNIGPYLVPKLRDFYGYPSYQADTLNFADRSVDARFAKVGTLNEIDYPTGGVTKFVYESNDFANLPSVIATNVNGLSYNVGPPVGYSIEGPPESTNNTLVGGGLRVQKILSYGGLSGKVKEDRFEYKNGDGKSSGKLMFPFVFYSTDEEMYTSGKKIVTRLSSNSNYNLGNSAQGAPIGYSNVKEYLNNNLFEEDYFENLVEKQYSSFYCGSSWPTFIVYMPTKYGYQPGNIPPQLFFSHSGIPNICNYSNGSLLKKVLYKTFNNTPVVLHESINSYQKNQLGYIEGLVERVYDPGSNLTDAAFFYQIPIVSNILTTKTENDYQDNGSMLTSTTAYTYNSNYQISSTTSTNSKGQTLLNNIFYPQDVVSNPSNFPGQSPGIYSQMISANQITNPVRSQSFINNNLVKSTELFYQNVPLASGLASNNFKPFTSKEFSGQSLAEELDYQYDYIGNITEVKKNGGASTAYLWNYGKLYPVAVANNAGSSDIAYTSFETLDDGGWTRSSNAVVLNNSGVTGSNSLNGSVSRTISPSKTYVVSVWAAIGQAVTVNGQVPALVFTKGNYGFYSTTIGNVSSITVSGTNFDEIRLYPIGAQMNTYAFDPYIGMRYQADANNKLSYYLYDTFNRLYTLKDQDQNIVKQNNYNYTSSSCAVYVSDGMSKNVSPQCNAGQTSTPVFITVPEGANYSLISQPDADSQNDAIAQSMANGKGSCNPVITIKYIQKSSSGTNITMGLSVPNGTYGLKVNWIDLSTHVNNGSSALSSTSPTITLQATGVTYLITVSAGYNGTTISGSRNFTFEAFENVEKSQTFIRANCSSGCNITYTVPAGTYSATTQDLADQMAINDINANGQANADKHY